MLKTFESEVLRKMLESEYDSKEIESLITSSILIEYHYTGAGYFLTISNEILPVERKVISKPILIGKTEDIEIGFILYLENSTLTIECHGWGEKNPPEDIRNKSIELKIITQK